MKTVLVCILLAGAACAETGVNVLNNGGFEKFSGGRRAASWTYGKGWRAVEGDGLGAGGSRRRSPKASTFSKPASRSQAVSSSVR